jgi:hypothetical protein
MALKIYAGNPGESWHNNTGKIQFQFVCNFSNSCARCIQYAGQIGPWWPLPLHPRCNCRNTPIYPGATAEPFVDYVKEVQDLDPAQQAKVMGAANWKLIQSGKVTWDDVVKPNGIKSLTEVATTQRLTVEQMVQAGIQKATAEKAAIGLKEANAADLKRKALFDILRGHGLTDEQIKQQVAARLASRFGVSAFGQGPTPPTPAAPSPLLPKPSPQPLAHAKAKQTPQTPPIPLPVPVFSPVPAAALDRFPLAQPLAQTIADTIGLPKPGTAIIESQQVHKPTGVVVLTLQGAGQFLVPGDMLAELIDYLFPGRKSIDQLTEAEVGAIIARYLKLKSSA